MGARTEQPCREHYCLFDTPIGPVGLAWSEHGLTRLQLPEADRGATESRLRGLTANARPEAPPAPIKRAIAQLHRYLAGERVEFSALTLDLLGVSPFHRQVYDAARDIGWGQTTSYGELARQAGSPGAARAVGQALGRNPVAIIIPCHRILASGKKVGGFSAFGGTVSKERLLALEGVRISRPQSAQQSFSFGAG